jgi:spoIIIJ-associated protein
MKTYELEDVSVESAINNFIAKTGYTKDSIVDYEVIETTSKGFLGFGKKQIKVKININDEEFIQRKAKIILSEIFEILGIKSFNFETSLREDGYLINILTNEASLLIGKNAQTLDALQFVLDRLLKKYESSLNIIVDIEHYRENFTNNIREKMDKKIEYVLTTGRREKLTPLVPILRKEIHNYAKKKGVRTESVGNGLEKAIYIYPNNRKRSFRNV